MRNPVGRRRHAAGPRQAILDEDGLARLIRDLLEAEFNGSPAEAARQTKISRATWYRLLGGKAPRAGQQTALGISQQTAAHLERLIRDCLGNRSRTRFILVTAGPGAKTRMRAYKGWARRMRVRWLAAPGTHWERLTTELPSQVMGNPSRRQARNRALLDTERAIRGEVQEYTRFEKWMAAAWVDGDRQVAAKMRILEPFLAAYETAFIESTWAELNSEKRRAAVRSAIKWERWLLLERGAAQHRAAGCHAPHASSAARVVGK